MERAYKLVIEGAFESLSPILMMLKSRSYGHANLCLAWRVLQSNDKDYRKAFEFRKKAISYYPELRYTREHIRPIQV